jgi:thiamine pyrophosphate-dependent acetolactate synthase large subunit-like protein
MAMKLEEVLGAIAAAWVDGICVPTMTTKRVWREVAPNRLAVDCMGFMGGASCLGLGLALARPERRVVVLDGDGSLLMQLGSLATIAGAAPRNLTHLVFKNGIYQSSGSQPIPGGLAVDYAQLARGAGYRDAYAIRDLDELERRLPAMFSDDGPLLVELETAAAETLASANSEIPPFREQAEQLRAKLLREGRAGKSR